ncbi:MAG: TraB/GumN family protein [Hyphomicrobium sp.]|uniref:TraB/GumN family protein n=1 Tax=Hyphomicrobium sp. TaxID=82 RepID=UPI001323A4DC|nr:TraB/GumN family protein [Hyphomicrobium sp.]KAB2944179.1 MAG: TraB/GumN family protein [Hyphomicrobium sp.]MBZ0209489.1 TraB/GumN family protein [Hyphomicrobium sp.]
MRLRLVFAFAVLAIAAALPHASVRADDKGAAADTCRGVDMLAETAARDPQTYSRIMAEAAATKNAGAILWRIEKDGRPASYLFGTVHLTDERVTSLSPAVKAGLNEAKVVALEVSDLSETATASVIAQSAPLVMFTDGRRLDSLLSNTEYDAVKTIIARSGMPVDLAASFKPWIVTMILSVSDCERNKVQQGARVLDMKIAEIGKARGLDVVGLETIPAQLESLAAVPEQQQIDMLRASLKFADRTNDMMETLVQLYLSRKISAAMPFQIALAQQAGVTDQAFAGFQEKLLTERNEKMRAVAEPLLDKGGVFIAVGALHLPGDKGLVALLRESGYTISPIE